MWKKRNTNMYNFIVAFFLVSLCTAMIPIISQEVPLMNFSSISDFEKKLSINISTNAFITSNDNYADAIVLFEPNIEVSIDGLEVKRSYENLNGFYATMPSALYDYLKTAWYVKCIQKNSLVSLDFSPEPNKILSSEYLVINDNLTGEIQVQYDDMLSWGIDWINAERVWGGQENAVDVVDGNPAGQGVKIAVIDSGVNYNINDLSSNFDPNCYGYDFYNNDDDPMDDHWHGTHVAGIIAAADNNEWGFIGVAPNATLYALKITNDVGYSDIAILLDAIDWAIEEEMDIINLSMRWEPSWLTDDEVDAVTLAVDAAFNKGIIFVAGSGNHFWEECDYPYVGYPAKCANAIAVGALEPHYADALLPPPEPESVSWWYRSNHGPELDFCAPGVDIPSTSIGGYSLVLSGTSQATPMVSGVCALILSTKLYFSPTDVKDILVDTVVDLGFSGHDRYYGYGQIEAEQAVLEAGRRQPSDSDNDGLPDKLEMRLGIDPYADADYDCDSLSDSDEVMVHGTDPLNSDTDGDSITDYDEIELYETDPLNSDTDDDGLNDWLEIRVYYTDPTLEDTDGDGLLDYEEIHTYDTNPLSPHSDTDGLTDYDEIWIHDTNPNDRDTDNDLLSDSWELVNSYQGQTFDPKDSSDGTTDHDGDLLQTGEEVYIWGTNWLNPDCDGDSFSDGLEIFLFGSDPLSASSTPETQDSDGDGYTDWEEYTGSCNTYDGESTDWFSADTDGDGWSDWIELHWRLILGGPTDPNDPNSHPSGGGGFIP